MNGLYTLRWRQHGAFNERTAMTEEEVIQQRHRLDLFGVTEWALTPYQPPKTKLRWVPAKRQSTDTQATS